MLIILSIRPGSGFQQLYFPFLPFTISIIYKLYSLDRNYQIGSDLYVVQIAIFP